MGKRRNCEATTNGVVDGSKESCTGTGRTETCIVPGHVDTLRGALLTILSYVLFGVRALCNNLFCYLRTSIAWGRGLPEFYLFAIFSLFSRPQVGLATAYCDKFLGLATNTLNVRNNNTHTHK